MYNYVYSYEIDGVFLCMNEFFIRLIIFKCKYICIVNILNYYFMCFDF